VQTFDGLLCRVDDNNIARFDSNLEDPKIIRLEDVTVNICRISKLGESSDAQDAATKQYVDAV
jgi:hypothetical protein